MYYVHETKINKLIQIIEKVGIKFIHEIRGIFSILVYDTQKKIISIGIAFSFQKNAKLPVFNNDIKLNYILTEKGIF